MTTYTAGKHPNSQANLIPWKPGVSPNPKGRPAGVTYVSEWVNALLTTSDNGTSKYRKSDLEKIVDQEDPGVSKAIAAQWLLNCMKSGDCFVTGKDGEILPARLDAEPGRERERFEANRPELEAKLAKLTTAIQKAKENWQFAERKYTESQHARTQAGSGINKKRKWREQMARIQSEHPRLFDTEVI